MAFRFWKSLTRSRASTRGMHLPLLGRLGYHRADGVACTFDGTGPEPSVNIVSEDGAIEIRGLSAITAMSEAMQLGVAYARDCPAIPHDIWLQDAISLLTTEDEP